MKKLLLLVLVSGMILTTSIELKAETKPSLAVMPFFVERVEDRARGAVCPVCKGIIQRGEIAFGSQNTLTRLLFQKMEDMGTFKVLSLEKVEEAFSQIDRSQFELTPLRSFIRLGKTLNIDFIFVGALFRFEERIGSPIGAEKPASVGFDVHLIRMKDEKMVWTGKFDETQRPLSENLLKIGSFIRRKGSWLRAEELSSVGMDEMLRRFPGTKELEEMP
jgi:TolB-like protein